MMDEETKTIYRSYLNKLNDIVGERTGFTFSKEFATGDLLNFLISHGYEEVETALIISLEVYYSDNDKKTTLSKAFSKIGGILYNRANKFKVEKWGNDE